MTDVAVGAPNRQICNFRMSGGDPGTSYFCSKFIFQRRLSEKFVRIVFWGDLLAIWRERLFCRSQSDLSPVFFAPSFNFLAAAGIKVDYRPKAI